MVGELKVAASGVLDEMWMSFLGNATYDVVSLAYLTTLPMENCN